MLKKVLLASVFVAGFASSANAATVFADDFNANAQALNGTPTGWTVSNGTVDIIGTGFFDFYPGNGNYLDMNGSTGDAGRIETVSVFNLVLGQTYTLSFDYGNNANSNGTEQLDFGIFVGSFSDVINLSGAIPALLSYSNSFVATAADVLGIRLFFEGSLTDGDNGGVILDNVLLTTEDLSDVPLPAAAWLLVSGLAGLGVLGRKRRRKVQA